jgi:ABC-type ATPase with predicted acetyltransferase domain
MVNDTHLAIKQIADNPESARLEAPWVFERGIARPKLSLLDDMTVQRGTIEDWRVLEGLHYKQHGTLPAGSHHFTLKLGDELVGVLVMASPKLLLKERHVLFPKLKPTGQDNKITNQYRMKWINANMSVVARVVVDTMYRGAGLAYRFTNLAARMEGKRYIEIQSSMSKYNQFAHRAGFQFVKPMRSNKYDVGIRFFRSTFKADPADLEAILAEWMELPEGERAVIERLTKDFYYKNSSLEKTGKSLGGVGERRVANMSMRDCLGQLQQMTLASPLYGVWQNPETGRSLPAVLPLRAFDAQDPTKPLVLP